MDIFVNRNKIVYTVLLFMNVAGIHGCASSIELVVILGEDLCPVDDVFLLK